MDGLSKIEKNNVENFESQISSQNDNVNEEDISDKSEQKKKKQK